MSPVIEYGEFRHEGQIREILQFVGCVGGKQEDRRLYASTAAVAYADAYNQAITQSKLDRPKIDVKEFEKQVLEAFEKMHMPHDGSNVSVA